MRLAWDVGWWGGGGTEEVGGGGLRRWGGGLRRWGGGLSDYTVLEMDGRRRMEEYVNSQK